MHFSDILLKLVVIIRGYMSSKCLVLFCRDLVKDMQQFTKNNILIAIFVIIFLMIRNKQTRLLFHYLGQRERVENSSVDVKGKSMWSLLRHTKMDCMVNIRYENSLNSLCDNPAD